EDKASAPRGGDLGWFARDAHGATFGAQVEALGDGEVSEPFKDDAGWHLVKREESRQAPAADDTRRQQVPDSSGPRDLGQEWERFLRELRGESYVDIRLGS